MKKPELELTSTDLLPGSVARLQRLRFRTVEDLVRAGDRVLAHTPGLDEILYGELRELLGPMGHELRPLDEVRRAEALHLVRLEEARALVSRIVSNEALAIFSLRTMALPDELREQLDAAALGTVGALCLHLEVFFQKLAASPAVGGDALQLLRQIAEGTWKPAAASVEQPDEPAARERRPAAPPAFPKGAPEASDWISDQPGLSPFAANRFDGSGAAGRFVAKLYEAGATKVVIDPETIEQDAEGAYASGLYAVLPKGRSARAKVLSLATREMTKEHGEAAAIVDTGQRAIRLWWD